MKEIKLHKKQHEAFEAMLNKKYETVIFAGGVGSGKTLGLAFTVLYMALSFPSTRYLIGRTRLSDLKKTTLLEMFNIAKELGVYELLDYNKQNNIITVNGQSEIILYALETKPSDPEVVDLGSYNLTAAFIDEAGTVDKIVYETLKERCRYGTVENNLTGKVMVVLNPTQNWVYHDFYLAWEQGKLPDDVFFVQASPFDNPFLDATYKSRLTRDKMSEWRYQTRVMMNWHYAEGDVSLFPVSEVNDAFNNELRPDDQNGRYISIDVAGAGKDSTTIGIWHGWELVDIRKIDYISAPECEKLIRKLCGEHKIPTRNVVIDANGIGSGLADLVRGCYRFIANKRPLNGEAYHSLKDQMYYRLATRIRERRVKFSHFAFIDDIVKELGAHKRYRLSSDAPAQITPKGQVIASIGHSPDLSDMIMMRCVYDYVTTSPSLSIF